MTREDRDIQRKLKVLHHPEKTGHVAKTCLVYKGSYNEAYCRSR